MKKSLLVISILAGYLGNAFANNCTKHPSELTGKDRFYENCTMGAWNLYHQDLKGFRFTKVHVSSGNFDDADFTNAILEDVTFADTKLFGAKFDGAKLTKVNFTLITGINGHGNISNASFKTAESGAETHPATLEDVVFTGSIADRINFESAKLKNVKFTHGSRGVSVYGAKFNKSHLENVRIEHTSNAYHMEFKGSTISKLYIDRVLADDMDFTGSKISDSMFSSLTMNKTKFNNSTISKFTMEHITANNMDFTGAKLNDGVFRSFWSMTETKFISLKELTKVIFEGVYLEKSSFKDTIRGEGVEFRNYGNTSTYLAYVTWFNGKECDHYSFNRCVQPQEF